MPGERDQPGSIEPERRGRFLSTVAVLLSLYAFSNFTMAVQHFFIPRSQNAMVFGVCFHSIAVNAVLGPLIGSLQAAYAYGLWKRKPWVPRIAIPYALYMPVNLVLFWFLHPEIAKDRVFIWPAWHAFLLMGFVGTGIYVSYHRGRFR